MSLLCHYKLSLFLLKFGQFPVTSDQSLHHFLSAFLMFKQEVESFASSYVEEACSFGTSVFQPKIKIVRVGEDMGSPVNMHVSRNLVPHSRFGGPEVSRTAVTDKGESG